MIAVESLKKLQHKFDNLYPYSVINRITHLLTIKTMKSCGQKLLSVHFNFTRETCNFNTSISQVTQLPHFVNENNYCQILQDLFYQPRILLVIVHHWILFLCDHWLGACFTNIYLRPTWYRIPWFPISNILAQQISEILSFSFFHFHITHI